MIDFCYCLLEINAELTITCSRDVYVYALVYLAKKVFTVNFYANRNSIYIIYLHRLTFSVTLHEKSLQSTGMKYVTDIDGNAQGTSMHQWLVIICSFAPCHCGQVDIFDDILFNVIFKQAVTLHEKGVPSAVTKI